MSFSHVQGAAGSTAGSGAFTVTLGSNPLTGNLVCVGIACNQTSTFTSVKDGNNNSYTVTSGSPSTFQTSCGQVFLYYLLSAPSNANRTITITPSSGTGFDAWADEFSVTGGSQTFDKDAKANTGTAGTTINTPSITPTNSGSLLYSCAAAGGTISAPAAGGTLGSWTGAGGAITNGDMAEYDLSASSATAVQYTQSSGAWSCMAMSIYIAASGPTVAQTSPTFDQDDSSPGRQALGFYCDDDTYGPNVAGWPGIGNSCAIPKTFEMDCDTTSRNFDLNTAYMREPAGELPTVTWSGGTNANAVPPPKLWDIAGDVEHQRNFDIDCAPDQIGELEQPNPPLLIYNNPAMPFEWDGADVSRNIDQFLAQQQLLDQENTPPQNFYPTMDWTADFDWRQSRDTRVVEDESADREARPFAPAMDWSTWGEDVSQQWRDLNAAPDDVQLEEYYYLAPLFPLFGWDDPFDVAQGSPCSPAVLELEDRELVWPIPVSQILNLGWDQDALESRWFDNRVIVDEDAPASRPFSPTADWTSDYDWAQSRDSRVVEYEDPTSAPQNYFPLFGWDDAGWERDFSTRVVEDEDERELVWPIPVMQILNLGWDQDALESRWFEATDPVSHSERSEESASLARPFTPTLAWDDYDWSRSFDTHVIVQDDMDSRPLQAIALQVIALALQQMLAVPLLGLQAMTIDQAELAVQQMLNVMMLGIGEIENEV